MKAKILIDDGIPELYPKGYVPRFKKGEIGEVMENDFEWKYDYKLLLKGVDHVDNLFGGGSVDALRIYYFHKEEVELLNE